MSRLVLNGRETKVEKSQFFFIKAIWDELTGVFYSESDIVGLHIEANTMDEFQHIMAENAFDLVAATHIKPREDAPRRTP